MQSTAHRAGLPENPHPLKTGQGGHDSWRHGGFDFGLSNAELADVEIDEQAGTAGVAFPDFVAITADSAASA